MANVADLQRKYLRSNRSWAIPFLRSIRSTSFFAVQIMYENGEEERVVKGHFAALARQFCVRKSILSP